MIGKKLKSIGAFACLYTAVYMFGSAIFGAVTEFVRDYQLLRLILFSAIAALIGWIYFSLARGFDRSLLCEYRQAKRDDKNFLLAYRGFRTEIILVLIVMILVALFLAMTKKQLVPGPGISNATLAVYVLAVGYPVYLALDLASWAVACAVYRQKIS